MDLRIAIIVYLVYTVQDLWMFIEFAYSWLASLKLVWLPSQGGVSAIFRVLGNCMSFPEEVVYAALATGDYRDCAFLSGSYHLINPSTVLKYKFTED